MKKALSLLFVFMLLLTAARAESLVISHIDETNWFNPGRFNTESGYLSLVGMDGLDDPDRLGRALLRIPGLKKVDLSGCPMTDAQLADLRSRMADHGIEVVWTLYLPHGYSLRTDDWVFSTHHNSRDPRLSSADVDCLRYATSLRALDLGHNWIIDASFLEPLTELRVLILSDNKIESMDCLAGKPLEYLEAFNNHIKDISFLAGCDTLIDLNLCHTWVSDLSPLYHLKSLRRIWMGDVPTLTYAERKQFLSYQQEQLEDYDFWVDVPTAEGWRGDEYGPGHPRYEIIKAMFKEGVYYDFNTVLRPEQYVRLHRTHTAPAEDNPNDTSNWTW